MSGSGQLTDREEWILNDNTGRYGDDIQPVDPRRWISQGVNH